MIKLGEEEAAAKPGDTLLEKVRDNERRRHEREVTKSFCRCNFHFQDFSRLQAKKDRGQKRSAEDLVIHDLPQIDTWNRICKMSTQDMLDHILSNKDNPGACFGVSMKTLNETKSRFHTMAKRVHPDKCKLDSEKSKIAQHIIQEAKDILINFSTEASEINKQKK